MKQAKRSGVSKRKPKAKAKGAAKAKPKAAKAKPKAAKARAKAKPAAARRARAPSALRAIARHGVLLVSARGPVPSVAEVIAGEPIVGSWWSHPRAHAIFAALSAIPVDGSGDVRCFKLVDHKVTFVHRRLWPALACLARAGVLAPERVAAVQQEHLPGGAHRNLTTPFPDWVPDDVDAAARALSIDQARAQLGPWL